MKRGTMLRHGASLLLFVALMVLAVGSSDSGTSSRKPETWEYKLAVIQEGYVPEGHATVESFRRTLDRLERKCGNSREDLSDLTVVSHRLLTKKYSVNITLLEVMNALDDSIPDGTFLDDCDSVAALFVMLRGKGG